MECSLCLTNGGELINGMHAICNARAKRGAPIRPIGNKCLSCQGSGNVSKATFCAEINPPASVMDAFFKPCPNCDGSGITQRKG
jgi:hypothetical protein